MKLILTSDTHYGVDHVSHQRHAKYWREVQKVVAKEDVRAIIWAGDLACNRQRQLVRSIQQAREYLSIPILLVRGNHDFWDAQDKHDRVAGRRSFGELQEMHVRLFERYSIHHLEAGPKVIDDVIFCGWDGWYGTSSVDTNDAMHMFRDVEGCPMHVFMSNRAWKKFEEVLATDVEEFRAAVAVTHFNPYVTDRKWENMCANQKFYDMIKEKFDVFCCGHNHQEKDRIEEGCRVLNSGSDYGKPKFKLFEV